MAEQFVWRGLPIKNEQGDIVAVRPVRGIEAEDGLTYPGVLSHDAEGNAFTYRQVPSAYSPTPIEVLFFLNTPPRLPNTKYVILADGIIRADDIIMA